MRAFTFTSIGFSLGAALFLAMVFAMPLIRENHILASIVILIGGIIGSAIGFAIYYLATPDSKRLKGVRSGDFAKAASGKGGIVAGSIIVVSSLLFILAAIVDGRAPIASVVMLIMGIASIFKGVAKRAAK